jgi:hypothetical protein
VLALEPVPTCVEGLPATEGVLPSTARLVDLQALPRVLDELLPFDARVEGRPDVWVHHRRCADLDLFFLANTSLEIGGKARVRLRGCGALERWDLVSGAVEPLGCRQDGAWVEAELDLPAVGSQLLALRPDMRPISPPPAPITARELALSDGAWQVELRGPNALTLDHAALSAAGGDWSEPLYILDVHTRMAELGVGTPFALRFDFEAEAISAADLELVLESPRHFTISFNGVEIPTQADNGFWRDTAFRRLALPGAALRRGHNEIILRGSFRTDSELESMYLTGAFGVQMRRLGEEKRSNGLVFDRYAPERRITPAPVSISGPDSGGSIDLTAGGLAFFAGTAVLTRKVQIEQPPTGAVYFSLGRLNAAVARLRVNGQDMGALAWEPLRWEIGGALRAGENLLEIELTGTLRNLLGPHHLNGGDPVYTGPDSYRGPRGWTEDWILVPFGFGEAKMVWIKGS